MTKRAGAVLRLAGLAGLFGLLLAGYGARHAVASDDASVPHLANFGHHRASQDARYMANWVVYEGDNRERGDRRLPFVIVDKKEARVYVFDASGTLRGEAPALLGRGRGDTALPGIGATELSGIAPRDRVTQAGRFVSSLGPDSHGEDVLWLDHDGGLAMHRVITTNPKEQRLHRLATPSPLDNRISWGCINLPVKFFKQVLHPVFKESHGIVYILPETKPIEKVFESYDAEAYVRKIHSLKRDAQ